MGVPKFYRWISEHYPQINQLLSTTTVLPEFDNFYLDMNGIIHGCTHPNDQAASQTLTVRDMMLGMFRYIDRIVSEIVKPKKILFMAIDGVAPRAKLNQQRARRFRAGQDRLETITKMRQKGEEVNEEELFDSNCITPGTEFMELVGKHMRWFIRKKVKEDPLWRNLKIIFSGHDVPGEGEHKIMQFIRELRADPNCEPNQRHCMCGQDADLIMLGLASHEPHFVLLREVVDFGSYNGFSARHVVMRQMKEAQFQLLHLSILREYIALELAHECHWNPDQERLFDDFIFLTFLVGNDFLPHLPTLDISEHAFDVLISAYRQVMNTFGNGYLVEEGELRDLPRLEELFKIVGAQEMDILQRREVEVKISKKKQKSRNKRFGTGNQMRDEEEDEDNEDLKEEAYLDAILEALGKGDSTTTKSMKQMMIQGDQAADEEDEDDDGEGKVSGIQGKDYHGRYYYEKFKIIPNLESSHDFMVNLTRHYLRGLMWCIAYYIKGCISWTWYYPFHYGPMLQDMKDLLGLQEEIHFKLGKPFQPFQQLLGCLPPLSASLLPRPYQWLMTSDQSPVREFYPDHFGIDQDGKKNAWEAVVLLGFIDEKVLLAAETVFCPPNRLSPKEIARNQFGPIITIEFDPNTNDPYPSPGVVGIPLSDILNCQSRCVESKFVLEPSTHFESKLLPGTIYPIAGFPSLTILPVKSFRTEAIKINVFGSNSKYKSLIIAIKDQSELIAERTKSLLAIQAEKLIGHLVYVNYPQIHEAKVVGISNEYEEIRLDMEPIPSGNPSTTSSNNNKVTVKNKTESIRLSPEVVLNKHDDFSKTKWKSDSSAEEDRFLRGRGQPGTGGLDIGMIQIRITVVVLQGLDRDYTTGRSKKIFGKTEIDIPIQLVVWTPPVVDRRFEETDELPVERLFPLDSTVLAITGDLIACMGKVVGPHTAKTKPTSNSSSKRSLETQKRVVDVEFDLPAIPETSFGYQIANAQHEEYYSSKDLCKTVQLSPSLLGKIVGSIKVEPGRGDIGLNLKRNGKYQLMGYAHRVEGPNYTGSTPSGPPRRTVWGNASETVKIMQSEMNDENDPNAASHQAEVDNSYWEYSAEAAALIFQYKTQFPELFKNLETLPHQAVYSSDQLFGRNSQSVGTQQVMDWMKSQPFFNAPRTPFTTTSLSRRAIQSIEKAADEQMQSLSQKGTIKKVVRSIPLEKLYSNLHRGATDIALPYNVLEPKLGDRVVNLTSNGVPFGLKGTVVTIHTTTQYVEVIFDEEHIGGKSLQGNCSDFRGNLCPWNGLLLISRPNEYMEYKRMAKSLKGKNDKMNPTAVVRNAVKATDYSSSSSSSGSSSSSSIGKRASDVGPAHRMIMANIHIEKSNHNRDDHVRGQFPAPIMKPSNGSNPVYSKVMQHQSLGNVQSFMKNFNERPIGPAVSIAAPVPPLPKSPPVFGENPDLTTSTPQPMVEEERPPQPGSVGGLNASETTKKLKNLLMKKEMKPSNQPNPACAKATPMTILKKSDPSVDPSVDPSKSNQKKSKGVVIKPVQDHDVKKKILKRSEPTSSMKDETIQSDPVIASGNKVESLIKEIKAVQRKQKEIEDSEAISQLLSTLQVQQPPSAASKKNPSELKHVEEVETSVKPVFDLAAAAGFSANGDHKDVLLPPTSYVSSNLDFIPMTGVIAYEPSLIAALTQKKPPVRQEVSIPVPPAPAKAMNKLVHPKVLQRSQMVQKKPLPVGLTEPVEKKAVVVHPDEPLTSKLNSFELLRRPLPSDLSKAAVPNKATPQDTPVRTIQPAMISSETPSNQVKKELSVKNLLKNARSSMKSRMDESTPTSSYLPSSSSVAAVAVTPIKIEGETSKGLVQIEEMKKINPKDLFMKKKMDEDNGKIEKVAVPMEGLSLENKKSMALKNLLNNKLQSFQEVSKKGSSEMVVEGEKKDEKKKKEVISNPKLIVPTRVLLTR